MQLRRKIVTVKEIKKIVKGRYKPAKIEVNLKNSYHTRSKLLHSGHKFLIDFQYEKGQNVVIFCILNLFGH